MKLKDLLEERRAFRSLSNVEIGEELIRELALAARLSPSCFNNQPWRFVFVHGPEKLEQLKTTLSRGNNWARAASMIVAVTSRKELDCQLKGRDYYLFDTGMATAHLILMATERGLVAHPIAGYDEEKAKEILRIPPDMKLITLIIVGKHARSPSPQLSEKQQLSEETRPERLLQEQFAFTDTYKERDPAADQMKHPR